MQLKLSAYPVHEAASITGIRLALVNQTATLLTATKSEGWVPIIAAAALGFEQQRRPLPVTLKARLGVAQWDAVQSTEKLWSVVATAPGSAISPLWTADSKQTGEALLTGSYPRGIFADPRVVKRFAGPRPPMTAIAQSTEAQEAVLFLPDAAGAYGKYQTLPCPQEQRLQQALLVRQGERYILFCKNRVPMSPWDKDAGSREERKDSSGESASLGVLSHVWLDANFHALGKPVKLAGAAPVFEFDADVRGDEFIVFATTQWGFLLASEKLGQEPQWAETKWEAPLSSPALAVAGAAPHVAVMQSAGPSQSILTGDIVDPR